MTTSGQNNSKKSGTPIAVFAGLVISGYVCGMVGAFVEIAVSMDGLKYLRIATFMLLGLFLACAGGAIFLVRSGRKKYGVLLAWAPAIAIILILWGAELMGI